ncbi:MAG: hypothetical protein WC966_01345 [Bradymonadales bacterium]
MQSNYVDREEAVATIETWLLAPSDFMDILPSLAALRGSHDYAEQRRALSIYSGRSEAEIDISVDGFLAKKQAQAAPSYGVAPHQAPMYGAPQSVHYIHHYNAPNTTNCAMCNSSMPIFQGETRMKRGGCLLMFLFGVFLFPLFWLPIVLYREPKPEIYCQRCKKYHQLK